MADKPQIFDASFNQRIVKAVKSVEGSPIDNKGGPGDAGGRFDKRFWAKIRGEDPNNAGNYKWTREKVSAGSLADDTYTSGDKFNAAEINGAQGIDSDTMVLLTFAGTDDNGDARYLFDHGASKDDNFWAKITGATSIGTNRWSYSWTEQKYMLAGTFQDLAGGRTSAGAGVAYNTVEANNSASSIQGNSVDVATLPTGFAMLPVQGAPVVRMKPQVNCNGATEYLFAYENGVGGTCS